MFDQEEGEEARRRAREDARERTERLYAGDWVAGRLTAHGKAPYLFDPDNEPSYYVRLQTAQGRQTLWGADLERAIRESKSGAKVGNAVGVRILSREKLDEDRTWNRWEVDRATYIVKVRHVARDILETTLSTLRAAREGASVTGSDLLIAGAETLARVKFSDDTSQKQYVAAVREAAGLKPHAFEEAQPRVAGERAARNTSDRQEQRGFADRLYAGDWVGGKLLEHGKAPYRFKPENPESYYIRLQTAEGRQVLWGGDLQRAVSQSQSHAKVGDPVSVRIASREQLDNGRMMNRWEVDHRMHLVKERRAADEVLMDPLVSRRAGYDGAAMTGGYLLVAGARMLARVQFTDDPSRLQFVSRIQEVAARKSRLIEESQPRVPDGTRARDSGPRSDPISPQALEFAR